MHEQDSCGEINKLTEVACLNIYNSAFTNQQSQLDQRSRCLYRQAESRLDSCEVTTAMPSASITSRTMTVLEVHGRPYRPLRAKPGRKLPIRQTPTPRHTLSSGLLTQQP